MIRYGREKENVNKECWWVLVDFLWNVIWYSKGIINNSYWCKWKWLHPFTVEVVYNKEATTLEKKPLLNQKDF
jgi:hypothetical protein